jgi:transposase
VRDYPWRAPTKASFVLGIDPGKSFFAATLLNSRGEMIWKGRQFAMTREGIESLASSLPEGDLTIGIEASGRIDDNLLAWFGQWTAAVRGKRSVKMIRINPGQSARFGGPKPRRDQTDGSDSEHVAEFTRVYTCRLEAFNCDPKVQSFARLVNERQRLVEDLTAMKNRIHEQLLVCFPEFMWVFRDPFAQLARAVLREVPTARCAVRRRALSLARVKAGRRGPSLGVDRARQLIKLAEHSIASAGEDHDGKAMVFLLDALELLERRLASIEETFTNYVEEAKNEVETHPDNAPSVARQIELLDSVPGMGLIAASTLVLGTRGIARFCSGKAMSAQWASCPERAQTGTSLNKTRLTARGDHKRRAMLYLNAQTACTFDPAFAFHKWRMIQKGLCPQQAVCATMNRMARVSWTLVAKNQLYDVNHMIDQIKIHHADLWKTFARLHQNDQRLWKNVELRHKKIA